MSTEKIYYRIIYVFSKKAPKLVEEIMEKEYSAEDRELR